MQTEAPRVLPSLADIRNVLHAAMVELNETGNPYWKLSGCGGRTLSQLGRYLHEREEEAPGTGGGDGTPADSPLREQIAQIIAEAVNEATTGYEKGNPLRPWPSDRERADRILALLAGHSPTGPAGPTATGREHDLKTWPAEFAAVAAGVKPFEVRREDRDFREGDVLVLREWDHMRVPRAESMLDETDAERVERQARGYTGRSVRRLVTYVLTGGRFGLPIGLCVLGLAYPSGGPVGDAAVDADEVDALVEAVLIRHACEELPLGAAVRHLRRLFAAPVQASTDPEPQRHRYLGWWAALGGARARMTGAEHTALQAVFAECGRLAAAAEAQRMHPEPQPDAVTIPGAEWDALHVERLALEEQVGRFRIVLETLANTADLAVGGSEIADLPRAIAMARAALVDPVADADAARQRTQDEGERVGGPFDGPHNHYGRCSACGCPREEHEFAPALGLATACTWCGCGAYVPAGSTSREPTQDEEAPADGR